MDWPGFESQRVPIFYLFSKCPEPLRDHPVFCSIGTEQYNGGQNGWDVMLTTSLYLVPRLRKSGDNPLLSKLICGRYSGTFTFLTVTNNVLTYIYLFKTKFLGIHLIWVIIVQMLKLWLFNRTTLRPSSRCTREWQPTSKPIICARLLLHTVEVMGWDAELRKRIFRKV
jgi:hypothetical protein